MKAQFKQHPSNTQTTPKTKMGVAQKHRKNKAQINIQHP
jgi:hypothetical protein